MAQKTKILHISKYFPPYIGGIETYCHDFASVLKNDESYEQLVIAFGEDKTIDENYDGINVIRVHVNVKIASQPLAKEYKKYMYKAFREFKPDIVVLNFPNPFASHFMLKTMKKYNYKGKFVIIWHADIIKQKFLVKFFDKHIKTLINKADVICPTTPNYLKNTSYLPYYPNKKYHALPCMVSKYRQTITDEQKEKALQIKEEYKDKTILFFYGRHVPYKGLTYLIDADNYLDQDKVEILIAGKGPETENLKEQAKDKKNIHFIGKLSDDDINSYLLACDIFTFPSITRNEAFGIALAEAMYFSKPAVTFTIKGSGVNYVSLNNVTGLEAKNSNSKDYADKINQLINDKKLYSTLAKNAKERVEELFTQKNFSKQIYEMLDSLK